MRVLPFHIHGSVHFPHILIGHGAVEFCEDFRELRIFFRRIVADDGSAHGGRKVVFIVGQLHKVGMIHASVGFVNGNGIHLSVEKGIVF